MLINKVINGFSAIAITLQLILLLFDYNSLQFQLLDNCIEPCYVNFLPQLLPDCDEQLLQFANSNIIM